MTIAHQQPRTMTSSLDGGLQSEKPTPEKPQEDNRNGQIVALLVKLNSHFPQSKLNEQQAKHKALDFLEDLKEYTVAEIDNAIRDYRTNPESEYFPTPGKLLKILAANKVHRAQVLAIGKPAAFEFGEGRPLKWWYRPKSSWNDTWREHEVPAGEMIRDSIGSALREPKRHT